MLPKGDEGGGLGASVDGYPRVTVGREGLELGLNQADLHGIDDPVAAGPELGLHLYALDRRVGRVFDIEPKHFGRLVGRNLSLQGALEAGSHQFEPVGNAIGKVLAVECGPPMVFGILTDVERILGAGRAFHHHMKRGVSAASDGGGKHLANGAALIRLDDFAVGSNTAELGVDFDLRGEPAEGQKGQHTSAIIVEMMRRIAVGSKNPVKMRAAERVVGQIWPSAEVVGVEVSSGIAAQPGNETETRQGAANRARAALAAADADLGLGLEGGVDEVRGRLYLVNTVVAVDRQGQTGEGGGVRMELPPSFRAGLKEGRELGELVDLACGQSNTKQKGGAIGWLTAGLADRQQSFEQALTYALVRWLAPAFYPAHPVVTFRASTPADLPMILAAESQGLAEGFIGMDTAEQHQAWMRDADAEHRVILRDRQAVGYLILRGLAGRDDAIEVKRICLTERGAGIGSAVFAALLPWAFEERGAHRLWLDVYVENTRARRLYESAGLREEGRLRESVRGPEGYRTLILMSMLRAEWQELLAAKRVREV